MDEELTVGNQGWTYPLRERRAPRRFPDEEHVLLTDKGETKSFEEVKRATHNFKWLSAMQDEMDSMHKNDMYELTKLRKGKRALWNKWVYKLKSREDGNPPMYKGCIVVKAFEQKKGMDFDEIFGPMVKMTSIQIMLSIVANMDLKVEQLDVNEVPAW